MKMRMSSPEPDPRKNEEYEPSVKNFGGGKFEMITPDMLEEEKMTDFFSKKEMRPVEQIISLLDDFQEHNVNAADFVEFTQLYKKKGISYREMMEMFIKENEGK